MTYVAKQQLSIGEHFRLEGEEVPEAKAWAPQVVDSYIKNGLLEEAPDGEFEAEADIEGDGAAPRPPQPAEGEAAPATIDNKQTPTAGGLPSDGDEDETDAPTAVSDTATTDEGDQGTSFSH